MMLLAVMTMALTRLPPKTTRRGLWSSAVSPGKNSKRFVMRVIYGYPMVSRYPVGLVLMKWPDEAFIFWCSCLLAKRV